MLESLHFMPVDAERLERAMKAAQFCGQTCARIANARSSGRDDKAAIWEHELIVWQRRQDETSNNLPHQNEVIGELREIYSEAYTELLSPYASS